VGKIHYSEIEIEKGGEIEGSLSQGAEPFTPPVTASGSAKT